MSALWRNLDIEPDYLSGKYHQICKETADNDDAMYSILKQESWYIKSALSTWRKKYQMNEGNIPTRGRVNHESDEAKENARLRKELRYTQDALEILKKAIGIPGN